MKKVFILLLTIFLVTGSVFVFFAFHKIPTVSIKGHTFLLEIAKTDREKEIGLAKYTSFSNIRSLYFPFYRPDYYVFWMKGMHFSIDILYIRNKKIVAIFPSVPPPTKNQVILPTYQSPVLADAVLEIMGGLSQQYGFRVGDSVKLTE